MQFYYTARKPFNPSAENKIMSWRSYVEWSKIYHLKELVSLDNMLCELAMEVNYESEEVYNYMLVENGYATDLFNSLEFVLSKVENKSHFNLLTIIKEPAQECRNIVLDGFEFKGYELL